MMTALSFGYTIPLNKLKDEIQICTVCWTYAIKTICSDFFFFFQLCIKYQKCCVTLNEIHEQSKYRPPETLSIFLCVCVYGNGGIYTVKMTLISGVHRVGAKIWRACSHLLIFHPHTVQNDSHTLSRPCMFVFFLTSVCVYSCACVWKV